ncbi:MAG: hypothetical protein HY722_01160 [Planctomycetes bacterium]|nr:hypothetical protein [Planctomycetota bacterium]
MRRIERQGKDAVVALEGTSSWHWLVDALLGAWGGCAPGPARGPLEGLLYQGLAFDAGHPQGYQRANVHATTWD